MLVVPEISALHYQLYIVGDEILLQNTKMYMLLTFIVCPWNLTAILKICKL